MLGDRSFMIKNISIENFRQFDHLEVKNLKRINFFVGKNNCGKTTILEALFIMVNPQNYNAWANLLKFRGLELPNDLMLNAFGNSETNTIKLSIEINDEHCELKISPKAENETLVNSISNENNQAKKVYDYNITITKNEIKEVYPASVSVLESGDKLIPIKTFFNSYGAIIFLSDKNLINDIKWQISELFKKSQEHKLIELLKLFSNTITNILMIGNDIYIENKDLVRLPLALMGDGLKKYLAIACSLLDERLNYICIDEIENGLHFETQKTLLKAILRLSREKNIQMFITTHSYETLKFLSEIMQEDEFLNQKDDVVVLQIDHSPEGYDVYPYNAELIEHRIENDLEMRS